MYTACGIILKREDFRERDERVTLYTKDFGKISVVAKGTKRIEAKLRGSLDIFNFADIIFVEGSSFFILTNIDTRERFEGLTRNPRSYSTALLAANIVTRIFEDNARDEDFFSFIYAAYKKLNELGADDSLSPWLVLKKIQLKILESQGYKIDNNILSSLSMAKPSPNAANFLRALGGASNSSVRLSARDFVCVEEIFQDIFSYIFNYRMAVWTPHASWKN